MRDTKTQYIAIQVDDLGLPTDIHTQKAVLRQVDNDEYELQDLTIGELFKSFNDDAGFVRTKEGVDWRVYPIYERDLRDVTITVSWIQSELKYYEFDVEEAGVWDEI